MRRNLHVDFIGRRRLWFVVSGVLVAVAALSLAVRGLNLSIEFLGGSSFTVSGITEDVTAAELEAAARDAGAADVAAQLVRDGGTVTGAIVRTEEVDPGSDTEQAVIAALAQEAGAEQVEAAFVGPTFGERISAKMLQALVVFLAVVVLYISIRLELKMAVAALVALVHDLVLTAGAYSLLGFTVSPATVIALLTILGYSLYDTVIVFDRVKENTDRLGSPGRRTYGEAVNTSMNEVLWRSLNTTITSSLPVAALLFIGSQALGATTLRDVALALFIGMILGAYSSLFIAGPFLAGWKEREPRMTELRHRAERRTTVDAAEAGAEEDEAAPAGSRPRAARRRDLAPRDYVRGPGRRPRSRRR